MTETTSIDHLNRVEFYLDDWEDHVNFEVIQKCSQMTETIRMIKGYPRNHHYHSLIEIIIHSKYFPNSDWLKAHA